MVEIRLETRNDYSLAIALRDNDIQAAGGARFSGQAVWSALSPKGPRNRQCEHQQSLELNNQLQLDQGGLGVTFRPD